MTRKSIPSVERATPDFVAGQVERLKELFPECVAEGKINFEKLKETLGEIVDDGPERYSFTWAGKRDAIRLLQVPSRATLKPCPKESVAWETTKNVFIEGENLEVLKLLYKSYAGRVKMIYIDPPYNTGNDFLYPDNFADPLETYLKLTGQKDAQGNLLTTNPETSGRYHSAWLSMMYPRLFVARQLLREDGVIFISINDIEVYNLRLLMNEIFGEENFIAPFIWHSKRGGGGDVATAVVEHEYILAYARSLTSRSVSKEEIEALPLDQRDKKGPYRKGRELNKWGVGSARQDRPTMFFPIPGPAGEDVYPIRNDGTEGRWRWGKQKMLQIVERGDALFERRADGTYIVYEKVRDTGPRSKAYRSLLLNIGGVADGTSQMKDMFDGKCPFDFPKPTSLVRHLIQVGCENEDDIVLDFFAGSATAADAVMEANNTDGRNLVYVMVQLPEPTHIDSVARDMGFGTIADVAKERLRRAIKRLKDKTKHQQGLFKGSEPANDFGFRVFKLAESNHRQWRGMEHRDGDRYAQEMEFFRDPLLPGWKPENVIWEVAIKEGYGLSSVVDKLKNMKGNRVWRMTDPDRFQSFLICLDNKVKAQTVRALKLAKEDLFVCRDAALTDEQAANLALMCNLKTI